jgi:predicted amino acid-binding ACT domain protein
MSLAATRPGLSDPGLRKSMNNETLILTLFCKNRPGIVATVSSFLFERGADIQEAQQFDDRMEEKFFMRVVFRRPAGWDTRQIESLRREFASNATTFGMEWKLRSTDGEQARSIWTLPGSFQTIHVKLTLASILAKSRSTICQWIHRQKAARKPGYGKSFRPTASIWSFSRDTCKFFPTS